MVYFNFEIPKVDWSKAQVVLPNYPTCTLLSDTPVVLVEGEVDYMKVRETLMKDRYNYSAEDVLGHDSLFLDDNKK